MINQLVRTFIGQQYINIDGELNCSFMTSISLCKVK